MEPIYISANPQVSQIIPVGKNITVVVEVRKHKTVKPKYTVPVAIETLLKIYKCSMLASFPLGD